MGNVESKARLGEKVSAAKKKFQDESKLQSDRCKNIQQTSHDMIPVILESVTMSFDTCSAFLESSLLAAWHLNPKECEKIVLTSCKKVLNEPIVKEEWNWFKDYVLESSIWLFKTSTNSTYMYQELMKIANTYSENIIKSMDEIYVLLQRSDNWKKLMTIKNETIISRQDDKRVGLLKQFGLMSEHKCDEDIQIFMDGNVAVNLLVAAANKLNSEFQNHIKHVMGHYGRYQHGPLKKVERCQSKTENDYFDAKWPKSAKLLDIVRCSVTFNTLSQLINGYNGLMNNIKNNPTILKVSRVKNGFIDANAQGYRDIKVNVLYQSQIHKGLNMICEVQFLLVNYLWEKKKIHKLYNILRQEEFFRLVVTTEEEQKADDAGKDFDGNTLELEPNLQLKKHMKDTKFKWSTLYKCSVDSQTKLLGVEGIKKFACIDLNSRKVIFEQETHGGLHHNHHWITYNNEKYVTVQIAKNIIKFFSVLSRKPKTDIQIKVEDGDEIMLLEFDKDQNNFVMIINRFNRDNNSSKMRLQQHKINDIIGIKGLLPKHAVTIINLSEPINTNIQLRQMVLSNDAESVLIAGGDGKKYFHFVDLKDKSQHKLCSKVLRNTYSPCFLDSERVAVGDSQGVIEIWDVKKKQSIKTVLAFKLSDKQIDEMNKQAIILPAAGSIVGMIASQNILCVCSDKKQVKLYETKQFNEIFKVEYELEPYSLHVTDDLQYLTIGGRSGEMCNVYNIKSG